MKLPKSWYDINIEVFAQVYNILQIDCKTPIERLDQNAQLISLLGGIHYDIVMNWSVNQMKDEFNKISFVRNLPSDFKNSQFKLGGFTWKVNRDITKLTAAQYIDLSSLTENPDSIMDNLPSLLCLFCSPHKKKWFKLKPIELDFKTKREILKRTPVTIAYPLAVFFCKVLENLIIDIAPFLKEKLKKAQKEFEIMKAHSESIGNGT
jgi:hypothetical protein